VQARPGRLGSGAAAALVLLTLAAYVPAMQGGFVWDDDAYVTANRTLRSADGLRRIWLEPGAVPQYYPLSFTSLWLEYRLWGPEPTGYHVTNVVLHALAAILVWRVLARLAAPGAWFAAALFALHPVEVESVAWITERKNVLSAVFYLGALLVYLRFALGSRDARAYAAAAALFLAALLSKTVTASLPVAILVLLWWKRGRVERRDLLAALPFLVLGAALGLGTVWMETHHVGARGAPWDLSIVERCLVAGRAVWFYAGKLVWPRQLTFIYPRWRIDAGAWGQYLFPLAALVVVAVLFAARSRLGRAALAAALFFGLTLAPALGFVPVYPMRYSFVADHFQYHASLGLLALGAGLGAHHVRDGRVRAALGTLVLLVLGGLTWRQGHVYRDLHTLWSDTIAKNPGATMAHINLGMLHYQEGRPERAVAEYEAALRIDPADAEARDDLGIALAAAGRTEEALAEFAESLRLAPDDPKTHNNLANTLAGQGRTAEALAEYAQAVRLEPRYADAHNNLGTALALAGRTDEAIAEHEEAVRLDPDYVEAHHNLGVLLAERGRPADALVHQLAALRVNPRYAGAHYEAGNVLVALGRTREAIARYRDALALKPDWPDALGRLAWLLAAGDDAGARRPAEAVALAERACALTGNADPALLDTLAVAYAGAGRLDAALPAGRKALALATARGQADMARAIAARVSAYEAQRP